MKNPEKVRRKGRRRSEDPTKYAAPGRSVAFIRGVNMELKIAEPKHQFDSLNSSEKETDPG